MESRSRPSCLRPRVRPPVLRRARHAGQGEGSLAAPRSCSARPREEMSASQRPRARPAGSHAAHRLAWSVERHGAASHAASRPCPSIPRAAGHGAGRPCFARRRGEGHGVALLWPCLRHRGRRCGSEWCLAVEHLAPSHERIEERGEKKRDK